MARKGWILLWHKLAENSMWMEEPFTRGQAWVDLLLMASTQETENPGEIYCSKLYLMRRWKWSHCKLDRFFRRLEDESMIFGHKKSLGNSQQNSQYQKPLLTIVKYETYQAHRKGDSQQNSQQNSQQKSHKNSDIERRTEESARLADAGAAGRGKVSEIPEKFRGMFDSVEEFEEWRARNA